MIIDWYTIIFQIINFMVLVFLLRLFLYKPIIKAMDEREQKIIEREEEAGRRESEAEVTVNNFKQKSEDLEHRKTEILDKAHAAAEEEKQKLVDQARQEVDKTRQRWADAFEKEKETFIIELRRRIGQQSCTVARKCLKDLADSKLEDLAGNLFLQKIGELSAEEVKKLSEALEKGEAKVVLKSAFELAGNYGEQLQLALKKTLPAKAAELILTYRKDPDLICGLELETGGYQLSWNVDSYIGKVEEEILKELEHSAPAANKGEVNGGAENTV
jgi:F-type H+-transporting ATPase subunit b